MEGWKPFLHVDDNLLGLLDSLLVPCSKFEIGRVNPSMHSKSKSQPQQVFQVPFLFGGMEHNFRIFQEHPSIENKQKTRVKTTFHNCPIVS